MTRLIRLGDRPFGWIAFLAMATGAIVVAVNLCSRADSPLDFTHFSVTQNLFLLPKTNDAAPINQLGEGRNH